MKMKRILLSISIIAALCILTACTRNPDTYSGRAADIGRMFRGIFFGGNQEASSFTLEIKNDTAVKIYSAAIRWYVDGEVVGSRGALDAAGHKLLRPGQAAGCEFLADDFPNGELSEVKIEIFVKETAGETDFVPCGTVMIPNPVYGQVYPVQLAEDKTSDKKYSLVSGDSSLCVVEMKQSGGKQ